MLKAKLHNIAQAKQWCRSSLWPAIELAMHDGQVLSIELKKETRSTEQNRLMWAMLNDVASQVVWHGKKLTPENWKHIFSASLKRQEVVPGLDGGFVVLGQETKKYSKQMMSEMIELINAFGAQQGVKFRAQN